MFLFLRSKRPKALKSYQLFIYFPSMFKCSRNGHRCCQSTFIYIKCVLYIDEKNPTVFIRQRNFKDVLLQRFFEINIKQKNNKKNYRTTATVENKSKRWPIKHVSIATSHQNFDEHFTWNNLKTNWIGFDGKCNWAS